MMPVLLLMGLGDVPVIDVTDYTLEGPTTATVGLPSDYFTVTLGSGVLASPVVISPDDGGAGGSFSVVSVTLSEGVRSAVFRYTPVAAGTVTISVTNDDDLTDPDPIVMTISDPVEPDEIHHGPIVMLKPAASRWFHRGP